MVSREWSGGLRVWMRQHSGAIRPGPSSDALMAHLERDDASRPSGHGGRLGLMPWQALTLGRGTNPALSRRLRSRQGARSRRLGRRVFILMLCWRGHLAMLPRGILPLRCHGEGRLRFPFLLLASFRERHGRGRRSRRGRRQHPGLEGSREQGREPRRVRRRRLSRCGLGPHHKRQERRERSRHREASLGRGTRSRRLRSAARSFGRLVRKSAACRGPTARRIPSTSSSER